MVDAVVLEGQELTRRGFLYYIWGASMTLALAGSGGALLWFAFPRFREGEFGGVFTLPMSGLPARDD
jgi:cytochrome b6-f complex iron-sulfur subunit